MLNITIRGHDLSEVQTIEDLAEKTKEQGIHTLQLALGLSFPEISSGANEINSGMGNYVKRVLEKQEVSVGILSCYINMIHPDLTIREELLTKFEQYLRYASSFGASMVASETGCVLPEIQYTEENFTDEAFAEAVSVIRRLVKAGEKYQMMVGIEPGLNHPVYSLERVEQLIQAVDSDYLGIILDPTNLITSTDYQEQIQLVEEAFERFGEKICAVHLKDFRVEQEKIVPVNLGDGMIEYTKIKEIIKKNRPYLYVVLEETKDDGIRYGRSLLE
ncbi:TPA: sugar phosphate isomerase/epimerase family protein [Enterococcus faecium]|uniref:sugar phosphate isomerase/epimerase family protein n=1 Tax=Enterococcus faecium TaxID=1352 RepID=UPI000665E964|nr:sugar phosphate isomerase/epimerase family protein [Enterococcus faecium]EGO9938701.1 sugar phosphate isomerase/epimerase [Enterococcus faecium]EGP4819965.1 sugar phosphate isomerase/epimerase [Enterococcus faecium]EGP4916243.1 sugar phosphate isomerase/epimerase [Enterococcus faecium]EGP5746096.1 sugar phosphate isomerase/epimerase [Enterococcus faecium]EHM3054319.1 sugar phosphate isomerase/epimerase [Enterococcus faecium]